MRLLVSPLNATISAADVPSGFGCSLGSLAPGDGITCAGPIGVPASLATGFYYLGAIADLGAQVAESDEFNNARAADTGPTLISGGAESAAVAPAAPVHPVAGDWLR